jgi:hypothetical protein
MDEAAARRVLLAQAIETVDAEGTLLPPAEREQVDLRSRQDALHHGHAPMGIEEFVHLRAQRVLAAVGVHHPWLVSLQEPRPWQTWLEWGVPLAALIVGVATDAIGNPHRVDLVSLPLLGIVAWNIAMYLILFASAVWPRRKSAHRPWAAHVGRWTSGVPGLRRREGDASVQAAVRFHMDWFKASQALHVERVKRVLHLSAIGWALGVILSLLVRGLVVEYRVGWESTFLGPQQVYDILRVLRWPALLVVPIDTFTVFDVAQLRFSDGGGAPVGAPWVWMYAALLVAVVIVPRLMLATFAAWREERLARAFRIDPHEAYFERVTSLLASTRVQIGLLAHREADRERLLRAIAPEREELPVLVSSPLGDAMSLCEVPFVASPPPEAPHVERAWLARIRFALGLAPRAAPSTANPALTRARDECDVILHLAGEPGDDESARPLLQWLGKPAIQVDMGAGSGLAFERFARCWVQDRVFLAAIADALPADRRSGFDHVVRAWEARNDDRLHRAMVAVADHLLFAARQVEEVQAGTLSARNLLPAEREAQSNAREAAMARIVQRLETSAASTSAQLRTIHRVDESAAAELEHSLSERFVVRQPVDASHAGMAGAATGAAMGASVDLLAGGLTLGAAAALGALVGGGAAWIAAAWKNRASPTGATIVHLSDEMLEALLEAALLRYVALVHWARGWPEVDARWKPEVTARVQAERLLIAGYWNAARTQPPDKLLQPLARELERIARAVLMHMYPER